MNANPRNVMVAENDCNVCGTERIVVFHQALPELRVAGPSPEQSAQQLINRLTTDLDALADPVRREPIRMAIADVRAFLEKDGAAHPKRDQ